MHSVVCFKSSMFFILWRALSYAAVYSELLSALNHLVSTTWIVSFDFPPKHGSLYFVINKVSIFLSEPQLDFRVTKGHLGLNAAWWFCKMHHVLARWGVWNLKHVNLSYFEERTLCCVSPEYLHAAAGSRRDMLRYSRCEPEPVEPLSHWRAKNFERGGKKTF